MKLNELADILNPFDGIYVFDCDEDDEHVLHDSEIRFISKELGEREVAYAYVTYPGTLEVCLAEKED